MKKLIAISVMLALVAGAAFAETSVGGALELRWTAAQEATNGDIAMTTGLGDSHMTLSVSDDEGKAGGMLRYKLAEAYPVDGTGQPQNYANQTHRANLHNRAFLWWKPFEQLQLYLGQDGDGKFEPINIARWGYHQGDRGVATTGEFWSANGYIAPTFESFGFVMSVYPIDMVSVNLGFGLPNPFNWGGNTGGGYYTYETFFKSIYAQVNLSLDFGSFHLAYLGEERTGGSGKDAINFTFASGALVDGLTIAVGFTVNQLTASSATNQMHIGLAAVYSGGDWGVKFRMFVDGFDTVMIPKVGIMPYYNFGFMEARLNFEVNGISTASGAADPTFVINPYIVKNVGPLQVRMGFGYNTAGSGTWSVPIGAVVSF